MDKREKIEKVMDKLNEQSERIANAIGIVNGNDLPIVAASLRMYADAYEKKCIELQNDNPGVYEAYRASLNLMNLCGKTVDMGSEEGRREYVAEMLRGMKDDRR